MLAELEAGVFDAGRFQELVVALHLQVSEVCFERMISADLCF